MRPKKPETTRSGSGCVATRSYSAEAVFSEFQMLLISTGTSVHGTYLQSGLFPIGAPCFHLKSRCLYRSTP